MFPYLILDSFKGKVALLSRDTVAVRRCYFRNCGAFKDTLSFVSSFMSCGIRNSDAALMIRACMALFLSDT